jgi:hypothetical protein
VNPLTEIMSSIKTEEETRAHAWFILARGPELNVSYSSETSNVPPNFIGTIKDGTNACYTGKTKNKISGEVAG